MTIRVLLADDQVLVRAGFRELLESADSITIVAEAATGGEAVQQARRFRPHVVLMDIRMPGIDGLTAASQIITDPALASTKVVVVTTFDLDEYVFTALRIGASGFLTKDVTPQELRHAVHVVAAGDALLTPAITRRVIREFAGRVPFSAHERDQLAVLTDRERQVVALVAEGLSNDEIGERLFMSPLTAKTHVSRAIGKLNLRDRAQLVVLAYRSGLVDRSNP